MLFPLLPCCRWLPAYLTDLALGVFSHGTTVVTSLSSGFVATANLTDAASYVKRLSQSHLDRSHLMLAYILRCKPVTGRHADTAKDVLFDFQIYGRLS